jgi:hypothetical protein
MRRRSLAILFLLLTPAFLDAAERDFCGPLNRAIEAAEAQNRFADITGADAGLFHETELELPGAKLCVSRPDGHPAPSWRCLMDSEGKYTLVLTSHGRMAAKVEACLGSAWTGEKINSEVYLRQVAFTNPDSVAEVHVVTTNEVEPIRSWHPFRILVVVYSPSSSSD